MKGRKLTYREIQARLQESPDDRRKLFQKLIQHVSQGFSKDSFPEVTRKTLNRLFECYPDEFDEEEYHIALNKGMHFWENVGRKQSTGECLGNSSAWKFNMSARYGWSDKVDVKAEHSGNVAVQVVNYGTPSDSSGNVKRDVT